jgi:hypothetical protein
MYCWLDDGDGDDGYDEDDGDDDDEDDDIHTRSETRCPLLFIK